MKGLDIGKWSAGKLSYAVLYAITALTAIVFMLFYCIGYNTPSMWDESVNSPLLTDLVLVLMILMLVSALAVTAYSKARSLKVSHTDAVVNGIKGKKITRLVILCVMLIMAISFLAFPVDGYSIIDGQVYSDEIWLRMANMFVFTSIALIALGLSAILYAAIKNRRLKR